MILGSVTVLWDEEAGSETLTSAFLHDKGRIKNKLAKYNHQ